MRQYLNNLGNSKNDSRFHTFTVARKIGHVSTIYSSTETTKILRDGKELAAKPSVYGILQFNGNCNHL